MADLVSAFLCGDRSNWRTEEGFEANQVALPRGPGSAVPGASRGCAAPVAAAHGAKRGPLVLPRGSAGWASGYWREPSGATASTAGCQWAPEACLPRSASRQLEPRRGLACADQPGFGLERGSARAVAVQALRGCLFTRGGTGPCQPPACTWVLFETTKEAMHRKPRCFGRVRMEI